MNLATTTQQHSGTGSTAVHSHNPTNHGAALIKVFNVLAKFLFLNMDFTSSPDLPAIGAVIPGRAPGVSMSYHEEGNYLFVASEADSRLTIVNCLTGKAEQQALKCERERIHLVKAT